MIGASPAEGSSVRAPSATSPTPRRTNITERHGWGASCCVPALRRFASPGQTAPLLLEVSWQPWQFASVRGRAAGVHRAGAASRASGGAGHDAASPPRPHTSWTNCTLFFAGSQPLRQFVSSLCAVDRRRGCPVVEGRPRRLHWRQSVAGGREHAASPPRRPLTVWKNCPLFLEGSSQL